VCIPRLRSRTGQDRTGQDRTACPAPIGLRRGWVWVSVTVTVNAAVLIYFSVREEDSSSSETDSTPSAAATVRAVSGSEIGDRLSRLTGGGMSKMSKEDGAWCWAVGGKGLASTGTAIRMLSAEAGSDAISGMPCDALSLLTGGAI
jgi:hypothetical protein